MLFGFPEFKINSIRFHLFQVSVVFKSSVTHNNFEESIRDPHEARELIISKCTLLHALRKMRNMDQTPKERRAIHLLEPIIHHNHLLIQVERTKPTTLLHVPIHAWDISSIIFSSHPQTDQLCPITNGLMDRTWALWMISSLHGCKLVASFSNLSTLRRAIKILQLNAQSLFLPQMWGLYSNFTEVFCMEGEKYFNLVCWGRRQQEREEQEALVLTYIFHIYVQLRHTHGNTPLCVATIKSSSNFAQSFPLLSICKTWRLLFQVFELEVRRNIYSRSK